MNKKEGEKGTRTGFSTGACAAAATRGAVWSLLKQKKSEAADIVLPSGQRVTFTIAATDFSTNWAECGVIKDAGDDPDVTHGAMIQSRVSLTGDAGDIFLEAGRGVGKVTLPGLGLEVGSPDITRVPRKMIMDAVKDAGGRLLKKHGLRVVISVPGGEELAKKTELPRLGVVGGVGILGTTGIVRPYSTSAFRAGISVAMGVAQKNGYSHIVATTGGMSEKFAKKWIDLPEGAFVQMGDFVGHALKECVKRKIEKITISGMIGKLSKMAVGKMMTHAAGSEVDTRFLAEIAEKCGAGADTVKEIEAANTARHVAEIIQSRGLNSFFNELALRVCAEASRHAGGALTVECLMTDFEGNLIGRGCIERSGGKGKR
ncbi:MAG TPA: cobalt-precorrin-5B (C(1))-methyltransferase [Nitrospiria bacterium]|nr:cobalt-precorrin-5B (C(1))-methyltransferase [Nitrospiria bacterium]